METSYRLLAKSTVLSDHDTALQQEYILNDFIFTHQEKGGLFSGLIKKKETAAEVTALTASPVCRHFYSDFSMS